jgi:hypothetical protein
LAPRGDAAALPSAKASHARNPTGRRASDLHAEVVYIDVYDLREPLRQRADLLGSEVNHRPASARHTVVSDTANVAARATGDSMAHHAHGACGHKRARRRGTRAA